MHLIWPVTTKQSPEVRNHCCEAPMLQCEGYYYPCNHPATAVLTNGKMGKKRMCWDCAQTWSGKDWKLLNAPYVNRDFYDQACIAVETKNKAAYPKANSEVQYGCYWARTADGKQEPAIIWQLKDGVWAAVIGFYPTREARLQAVVMDKNKIDELWAFSSGKVIPQAEYDALREAYEATLDKPKDAPENERAVAGGNQPPEKILEVKILHIPAPDTPLSGEAAAIAQEILDLRDRMKQFERGVTKDNADTAANTYDGLGKKIALMKPFFQIEKGVWTAGGRQVDDKYRPFLGDAEDDKNKLYRFIKVHKDELEAAERKRVAEENARIAAENARILKEAEDARLAAIEAAKVAGTEPPPPTATPELKAPVEAKKIEVRPTMGGRAVSTRKRLVIKSYDRLAVLTLLKDHEFIIDALEGEIVDHETGERRGGILKKLLSAKYRGLAEIVKAEME